jgi:hypothetical protein
VQGGAVHVIGNLQGGAESRPARRVNLLDDDLDVARRLVGGDVAGGGGEAE